MELENVDTNTPSEQVDTTEESSNAVESVTPDNASEVSAYDAAFDNMDIENPDMSLFAEKTNVSEDSTEVVTQENNTEEEVDNADYNPFAIDEDGYLTQQLTDRGKVVRVTPEELFQFGNKGINYEQRNAEIKPFREHLNLLKDNPGVSTEDLKSLIDLQGGNKDALKHLISKYDVDVYDVDASDTEYSPDVSNAKVDDVQNIWSDYQLSNPEGAEQVSTTFDSISEEFRQELYKPDVMPLFIEDVEKGMFNELIGETEKFKSLYPNLSWLEAYGHANKRYAERQGRTPAPKDVAAPQDSGTPKPTGMDAADDIWNTPGVFEEMTKRLSLN